MKSVINIFLEKNYTLVLTSSSDEKIKNLKEKYGTNHFYYKVDLSVSDNLQECLNEISNDHKDISIIVNNAGIDHIEKRLEPKNTLANNNKAKNILGWEPTRIFKESVLELIEKEGRLEKDEKN